MYRLFSSCNHSDLATDMFERGFSIVNATIQGGILTILGEKKDDERELVIVQGYNHEELIEKINNENLEIEFSILGGALRYFFVRKRRVVVTPVQDEPTPNIESSQVEDEATQGELVDQAQVTTVQYKHSEEKHSKNKGKK